MNGLVIHWTVTKYPSSRTVSTTPFVMDDDVRGKRNRQG
jgi:hypothetical protein